MEYKILAISGPSDDANHELVDLLLEPELHRHFDDEIFNFANKYNDLQYEKANIVIIEPKELDKLIKYFKYKNVLPIWLYNHQTELTLDGKRLMKDYEYRKAEYVTVTYSNVRDCKSEVIRMAGKLIELNN